MWTLRDKTKKIYIFLKLDHKIKELLIGEYRTEVNLDLILKNLYALIYIVSKSKQLVSNLCDLLDHQKMLFVYTGRIK